MFTGIVESVGNIVRIDRSAAGLDLAISTGSIEPRSLNLGDSIAVNGVCLTVTGTDNQWIAVQVSNETIARTNFGRFVQDTAVNLERPVTLAKPLGGHLVTGHIDGIATCVQIETDGSSQKVEFAVPKQVLGKFMAEKGSVTIDGVSLTINAVQDRGDLTTLGVNLIPHTLTVTTLGQLEVDNRVHIEVDVVARYVHRLYEWQR